MYTLNPVFWAKKAERNGKFMWLPLSQHLEDTRQIAGLLWEHWLSKSQKNMLIQSIDGGDEETAKSLVQFLGAIHDIGKVTPVFQIKRGYQNSVDLDKVLIEKLLDAGFTGINHLDLPDMQKVPHALAGQTLLASYGVNEDVSSVIGGHHGKPIDDISIQNSQSAYKGHYFQQERDDELVNALWKQSQRLYFERALKLSGFESAKAIPEITQPGQVILSGLLIMADWIASNEDYFPLFDLDQVVETHQSQRIERAWKKWHTTHPIESFNLDTIDEIYIDRFKFPPRDVQSKLAQVIENTESPGIFILEAPMGQGKTEAALVAAEQLMAKVGASGMFFGLPTQATSNGIFPRIKEWLDRFINAVDKGEKVSLQLAHGKASLNEDYSGLTRVDGESLNGFLLKHGDAYLNETDQSEASQVNIDGGDDQEVRASKDETVIVNQWFTGRKTTALDDFVVGTVDQFLLAALKQKHLALRHLGFSKKVVVIDEVHAYDAYMNQYLLQAIKWMGAYGVPVIILSATLPADRREALIRAYLQGKPQYNQPIEFDAQTKRDTYPLISYTDGFQIKQEDNFEVIEDKLVRIKKIHTDQLLPLLEKLIQQEGVIGIIVNTVRKSQDLAKVCSELFGEELVHLLHSNFIATDRIRKEAQLMDEIGKNADRPERKIIIGTQVMEQSLDIDFDVMISDLAPMDLLIQRLGRLHRHDIHRPAHYHQAHMYVMGTDPYYEFEPGSSKVYGDYLLARTQYFLPEKLVLPGDISSLVQKVYGDMALNNLEKMREEHDKIKDKKEKKALTFRLGDPNYVARRRKRKSLVGWLKNTHENQSEEFGRAQVRDIQETVEVIAVKKTNHGYSVFGEMLDISDRINENNISKLLAQHTLNLPRILTYPQRIDQTINALEDYNKANLPEWQNKKWLKGSLGIIFDEDNNFELNGFRLHYDEKYGLLYEGVEDGGKI